MALTHRKPASQPVDETSSQSIKSNKPKADKSYSIVFLFLGLVISLGLMMTMFHRYWRIDKIKQGLLEIEKDIVFPKNKRVLVGVGGCLDIFVKATDLFDAMGMKPPAEIGQPPASLDTEEDIINEFLTFFVEGAAAERYVQSKDLFQKIRETALKLSPDLKLGGNGPVIARRMASEGADVMLAIQNEQIYRSRIDSRIALPGKTQDTERDFDLHIIMEFDKDSTWGPYKSTRANRYIIHRDSHNPQLKGLTAVLPHIEQFKPDLVVLGGLQMLDTYPFTQDELEFRLNIVQEFLRRIPKSAAIHFEMASFVNAAFLKKLCDQILPYAHSLGMNEQELPNLASILKTGKSIYISDSKAKISKSLDEARHLISMLEEMPRRNELSRVHIHTLAYQAVFTKTSSKSWSSGITTAVKSSLTATRYVCGDDSIDSGKVRMILDDSFSSSGIPGSKRISIIDTAPVSCWPDGPYEICLAPVLVCTQVKQTGGGGDNLTGVGLVYHLKP